MNKLLTTQNWNFFDVFIKIPIEIQLREIENMIFREFLKLSNSYFSTSIFNQYVLNLILWLTKLSNYAFVVTMPFCLWEVGIFSIPLFKSNCQNFWILSRGTLSQKIKLLKIYLYNIVSYNTTLFFAFTNLEVDILFYTLYPLIISR